jgi:hypothetical protein
MSNGNSPVFFVDIGTDEKIFTLKRKGANPKTRFLGQHDEKIFTLKRKGIILFLSFYGGVLLFFMVFL